MKAAALLAAATVALAPAAARADIGVGLVTQDDPVEETSHADLSLGHLAGTGADDLTVAFRDGSFEVSDAAGALSAGQGCTTDGYRAVRCSLTGAPAGIFMDVRLGPGDDRLRLEAPMVLSTATFSGGDGNDTLDVSGVLAARAPIDWIGTLIGGLPGASALVDGGAGDDVLRGTQEGDSLRGGPGDDELDGQGGFDVATYETATGPVVASLAAGTASDGLGGNDGLVGVEGLAGGRHDDALTAGPSGSALYGGPGSDVLRGGPGRDRLDGSGWSGGHDARRRDADRLRAGAGDDVLLGASDTVYEAGPGTDQVRDYGFGGTRATVRCGTGGDVLAGAKITMVVAGCERIGFTVLDRGGPSVLGVPPVRTPASWRLPLELVCPGAGEFVRVCHQHFELRRGSPRGRLLGMLDGAVDSHAPGPGEPIDHRALRLNAAGRRLLRGGRPVTVQLLAEFPVYYHRVRAGFRFVLRGSSAR